MDLNDCRPLHFTQNEDGIRTSEPRDEVDVKKMEKSGVIIVPAMGCHIMHIGAALLHTLNAHKDHDFSEVLVVSIDDLHKPKSFEEQIKEQSKIPFVITKHDIDDSENFFLETPKESYKDKHVQNYHIHKTPKTQAKKQGKVKKSKN